MNCEICVIVLILVVMNIKILCKTSIWIDQTYISITQVLWFYKIIFNVFSIFDFV